MGPGQQRLNWNTLLQPVYLPRYSILLPIKSCALTPGITGTWSAKVELEYASSANLSASIFNFASLDSSAFEVVLS
jgi:hypothetical protein